MQGRGLVTVGVLLSGIVVGVVALSHSSPVAGSHICELDPETFEYVCYPHPT